MDIGKILFINDSLDIGGIQRVNVVIANSLSNSGDVAMYTHNSNYSSYKLDIKHYSKTKKEKSNFFGRKSTKLLKKLKYYSFVIMRIIGQYLPTRLYFLIAFPYYYLMRLLKREEFSTIILNGSFIILAKLFKAIYPDINVVLWMHNNHDVYAKKYYKRYRKGFKESLKAADAIVVLTDEDKNGYSKYSEKVIKINNPLTIDNNSNITDLNKNIISFTSRYMIEQKGIDLLIEIAKYIPNNWKIRIAGSGDEESKKQIELLIMNANVKSKVELMGNLEGEALNEHYKNSSIFLSTSRWEGFSLVTVEAMSFGLPIIAFSNSGLDEVTSNGEYGILVRNGDILEISKILNKFIDCKNLRKEYSSKSLYRVKDFNILNITKKWEKLLNSLIKDE